jgi:ubiquinone/menaquinone biosynthesis C-methylase UbiE/uncharacterized protein YbaR (Trm112 family)
MMAASTGILKGKSTARLADHRAICRGLTFVCPLCKGGLEQIDFAYKCVACVKTFPLQDGIPDFRIFPDPYLGFEEDRRRTELILSEFDRHDFESLLEFYWDLSEETPQRLRKKFIRGAIRSERKARHRHAGLIDCASGSSMRGNRVLEIGSGTGGFLAAAAAQGQEVVGVDIAMRWLHVCRRRLMDLGFQPPLLVCCCAEFLPFAAGSFDVTLMSSTLEFVRNQSQVLSECSRTLCADGTLFINSVNRYSMATNPYVDLWGVGYLPRRWQSRYACFRRDASFENIRLLSYSELNRLASKCFQETEFSLPDIDEVSLGEFSSFTRWQVHVYRLLKRFSSMRHVLNRIGPEWDVKLTGPMKSVGPALDRCAA